MKCGCLDYFFSKIRQISTDDAPVRKPLPSVVSSDSQIIAETTDATDRISELPTFIIHHIMSYLSPRVVARTSILSKTWNQMRKSFPILDFDQNDFIRSSRFVPRREYEASPRQIEKFIEFIDCSLRQFCQRNFCIQKFRLIIGPLDDSKSKKSSSFVDTWIGLAIEKEVKELELHVISSSPTICTLPKIIFSAKSITSLKLFECKLEMPSDSIRFHSLKNLTLERVYITEQMLQRLSSDCPLLEAFCLTHCFGFKHLCMSKAFKLKIFETKTLSELESVEIFVPSLQELEMELCFQTRVIDLAGCSNLHKLRFEFADLRGLEFDQLVKKLPLLEELSFRFCCLIETMTISSNQLKRLEVHCCDNLKFFDLDTPKLLSFIVQAKSIPTFFVNASCPLKVEFYGFRFDDTRLFLNLRKFLELSNQIEYLKIYEKSLGGSLILDGFRAGCPLLPRNAWNLYLYIVEMPSPRTNSLDNFLSICYPRIFCVKTWSIGHHEFFQWLYKNLKNNRDAKCCNSLRIKCWRHYLKDVKIESLVKVGDTEELEINKLRNCGRPKFLKLRLDWCFSS